MTTDAAPEAAAETPPETPPEPSAAPSEEPAQAPQVIDPDEAAKVVLATLGVDGLKRLAANAPDEVIEEAFAPRIESRAQSWAARNKSDAELQIEAQNYAVAYNRGLAALKEEAKQVQEQGGDLSPIWEKATDLAGTLYEQLENQYLEATLRAHPVDQLLTAEERQKLASYRESTDRRARVKGIVDTYLNRALSGSPEARQKAAEAEAAAAESLVKAAAVLKGAAAEPPAPQVATGGMTWQQFQALPIEEQEKVSPVERRRMYQEDAQRRLKT